MFFVLAIIIVVILALFAISLAFLALLFGLIIGDVSNTAAGAVYGVRK